LTRRPARSDCEQLLDHKNAPRPQSAGGSPYQLPPLFGREVVHQVRHEHQVERLLPEVRSQRVPRAVRHPVAQTLTREDRGGLRHRTGQVEDLGAEPGVSPA
jgi:hypothetical protein